MAVQLGGSVIYGVVPQGMQGVPQSMAGGAMVLTPVTTTGSSMPAFNMSMPSISPFSLPPTGTVGIPQLAQPTQQFTQPTQMVNSLPFVAVPGVMPNVVTARFAQPAASQVTTAPTTFSPQRAVQEKGNNKVICLLGVSAHADLDELELSVERAFEGTKVVRRLPIWNKATVFVELNRPITWPNAPVLINDQGVTAVSSQKTCIALSARTSLVNVRFFLLDPTQDFDGDETQAASYARSQKIWEQSHNKQVWLGLGALLQRTSEVAWSELLTPRRPARLTDEGPRQRMYAQLFFNYPSESAAEAALNAADGKCVRFGHLKFIMRTAFAAAHTVAAAPRTPNPALVNAEEFGNIYDAVDRVRTSREIQVCA
eukprot:Hpha_TRINITY_DN16321_c3_g12::TRINITY_DN16321_c3_g12_i1::g.57851::m.57851